MENRTIKTTLGELADAEGSLARVISVKVDAKTRYHAVKLAKLVAAETKHYYEERNALVAEHGTGTPKVVPIDSPSRPAFDEAHKRLREVPVEVPWGPLTSGMVERYEDITGADLVGLGPLFLLEEEPRAAVEPHPSRAGA